jgi:hypothetical protein
VAQHRPCTALWQLSLYSIVGCLWLEDTVKTVCWPPPRACDASSRTRVETWQSAQPSGNIDCILLYSLIEDCADLHRLRALPLHIAYSFRKDTGGCYTMRHALHSAPASGRQLYDAALSASSPDGRCSQPSRRRPPSHTRVHGGGAISRHDDRRLCRPTLHVRRQFNASAGSAAISWSDDEPGMAPVQPVTEVGSTSEGASFLQVMLMVSCCRFTYHLQCLCLSARLPATYQLMFQDSRQLSGTRLQS